MSSPEPLEYESQSPNDRDAEHLWQLTTAHRFLGGILIVLGVCVPAIELITPGWFLRQHTTMESLLFWGKFSPFWILGICLIASSEFIARRKYHNFSFTVATIICLLVPFGTLLGIFAIVVLSRSSVKRLYERPHGESSR
jgi:hypothetical protein